MRQLNGIYTQYYNRRHRLTGHLFQGRYKSILVDQDAYLLELSRYIVLNPVKAGMVKSVDNWAWSSYNAMVGTTTSPEWLSNEFLLAQFSKQRYTAIKKYQQFVNDGLKNGSIWHRLSNQVYLGDKDFVDRVQKYLTDDKSDIQIPKIQRRPVARSLAEYESESNSRNAAIKAAYSSGAYSYQDIGSYFGLHFTRVGVIVRKV
jgi:putative transposase